MDKSSGPESTAQPFMLVLAATFTAQALEEPLAFWMDELSLAARVAFAPYNQIFQELLDPTSLLSTNAHGANVLLIRLEDWQARNSRTEGTEPYIDPHLDLEQTASDLLAAVSASTQRSPVPLLVVFCPASPVASAHPARSRAFTEIEKRVSSDLAEIPGVDVVSTAELTAADPAGEFYDARSDQAAHAPYTPRFSTALATVIARWLYSRTHIDYKAIVVDCDDTLWTGICGEVGPEGIAIDASRRAIQEYLVELHHKGVLVCLCSRNNEADVLAVFEARSNDMPLSRKHVVASKFNWKPKSENISALAAELQLLPEAFVFLDNNPVECAEVQANCPDVLAIPLPDEPEAASRFLRNLWIFCGRQVTDEARARTGWYRDNVSRARARDESPSMTDFLARLDLKIHFVDLSSNRLARASELTERTNQFNFTTIRRSEANIDALRRQGADCILVQVKDRFGDYGVVGLMIVKERSDALAVDTFLLSCRALGRGVEHLMLKKLGERALERGLSRIDLPFVYSGKNQPALDFLTDVAGNGRQSDGAGLLFQVTAQAAAQVRYDPEQRRRQNHGRVDKAVARVEDSQTDRDLSGGLPRRWADSRSRAATLVSIARDLYDLDQIHAQVSARMRSRSDIDTPYVEPRTPTERTIAGILAQVLGIDRVGVEDNFFQLGGHSLLAIQVLFRIREAFQVGLSTRLLYNSAFTAADLATRVLELQVDGANPLRVSALIEKVNELSDDEVRILLAGETDPLP
jgi:FkbH-like protein